VIPMLSAVTDKGDSCVGVEIRLACPPSCW